MPKVRGRLHWNGGKDRCKHGHEFTPENTRLRENGWRECIACNRRSAHAAWVRNRLAKAAQGGTPEPVPGFVQYGPGDTLGRRVGWIEAENGCHIWQGSKVRGYGQIRHNGRMVVVGRLRYEREVGPIPPGMWVLHNCPGGDNPACCNPAHMFLGTPRDNKIDSVKKGTAANVPCDRMRAKTHCLRGHEFTEANTYRYRGARQCRACWRIRWRPRSAMREKAGSGLLSAEWAQEQHEAAK